MPATAQQVPSEIVTKWQEIVDLLAKIIRVPAALVMKVEPPNIKVLVSSESPDNPYEQGELAALNTGLYCETVMKTRQPLFVPDALADEKWNSNPDIKLGMTSYLGFPIRWPNGDIFGTICVLDNKRNDYSDLYRKLLLHCRDVLETDLRTAANLAEELAVQNARLQLLLQLTKRTTSNLELREVLRTVSANVREVMHADAAGVAFLDEVSHKSRIYAVDFPDAKGFVNEEIVVTPGLAFKRAWKSAEPVIVDANDPEELGPEIYALVVAEGLNGHCLIPLVSHGRTVGVLIVARKLEGPFTSEDVDFLSEASGQIAIAIENALSYREISELKDKLAQEKLYLEDEIRSEMNFDEIVGKSPVLRRVLKDVETVGPTDSTVLIYGETGTGKELIARALHNLSPRRSSAFIKLNCAAIPTGLLESELFGHEKGAFTGAIAQRIGRFELANRGTIFLDEIGEIPLELQPKLLRVLQEREFERLGSTRTLRTDARLIAATNRDLAVMVQDGKFRSDLFYRLDVFPVRIPPLRERPEDIPLLVRHFTQQFARRMNKTIDSIPSETMNSLCEYHWAGNIRELQNVIERAVILSPRPVLQVALSDLPSSGSALRLDAQAKPKVAGNMQRFLEETERKQIVAALEESRWVIAGPTGAAARLGMKRSTLQLRMQKLGISRSNKPA